MAALDNSVSFYLFDIDDNLLLLPTRLYLWNAETQKELAVSSGDFANVQNDLGRTGQWASWAVRAQTFRDFRDTPNVPADQQTFVRDVQAALTGEKWRGPSWPLFVHAVEKQRPIAFVSARGHAPATIQAGLKCLTAHEHLPEPNVLAVYTVTNDEVRGALGAADPAMTIPSIKKIAIKDAVKKGLDRYGSGPPHRFGMSDDDPNNVVLAISAMRDCKEMYPDKRFFVINTNAREFVKLEVFPMMDPVTASRSGRGVLADEGPIAAAALTFGGNVSIYVSDMDRAVHFYSDTLGLRLRTKSASQWAEFDAGSGLTIGLHPANPPSTPAPGQGSAINVVLKATRTLEGVVDALKMRGVTFKGEILNYEDMRLATLTDPDGNALLLAQALYSEGTVDGAKNVP
jgi:catechol 2,3-dioxygenase-like lactoylglutathione lyase family enzyme